MHKEKVMKLLLVAVIGTVILFRVYLIIFTSQFGPDEAVILLRARQSSSCTADVTQAIGDEYIRKAVLENIQPCGKLPLGFKGHLGIHYGHYLSYWMTLYYQIFRFNLFYMVVFAAMISIVSPLLIYKSLAAYKKDEIIQKSKTWIFLFLITSPVALTYFLAPFWDVSWFIPISSIILFILFGKLKFPIKEIILGLILGIIFASHPQTLPLIVGIILFFLMKNKLTFRRLIPLFVGVLTTSGPYIINLFISGDIFNLRFRISGENTNPNILDSLVGIFRYFGIHSEIIINHQNPFFSIETLLANLTYIILIGLFILSVVYINKYRKMLLQQNPIIILCFILAVIYIPVSFLTNSALKPYEQLPLWFVPAVLMPVIIFNLFKVRAKYILSLLVLFNIFCLVVQYVPRLKYGTSIGFPLGPSWREQSKIAKQICKGTDNVIHKKYKKIVVGISPNIPDGSALTLSLPAITTMENQKCLKKLIFVSNMNLTPIEVKSDKQNLSTFFDYQ